MWLPEDPELTGEDALHEDELALLRPVAPSQGMMVETLRDDLAAHRGSPDKTPARRLATLDAAGRLEGQLTASLQLTPADYPAAAPLVPVLEQKVGRIIVNGWPTGVAVTTTLYPNIDR